MLKTCKSSGLLKIRGMSYSFLLSIQDILRVNILVMEYPGYGVYAGYGASESLIKSDAEDLYNYLVID